MPAGDLAARLLQGIDGRARRHVQAALAARELVLAAVLLHRVGHVLHHLVDLAVERLRLHRLQHLADVAAVPFDHRLAQVGHVLRVHAAAAPDEVALHAALPGVVVDVFGVAVDGVLRLLVVVNQPRAERPAPYVAVAVQHERILSVRVHAAVVFARLRLQAEARLGAHQQRAARELRHVHDAPSARRVVALVPEFDQRHLAVPVRRLRLRLFALPRVCVAHDKAPGNRVVLLHPADGRVRRLEARAPVLNVLVHRVGVEVLRMPAQHARHARAVLHVVVPEHLRHARAGDDRVLHDPLVLARPARVIEHEAHHVAHLLRALHGFLAFGHHLGLGHVVDLVGHHVVHAAVERAHRRTRPAPLALAEHPHPARFAHLLVLLAQLLVKVLKERIAPPQDLPLLAAHRLLDAGKLAASHVSCLFLPSSLPHCSLLVLHSIFVFR